MTAFLFFGTFPFNVSLCCLHRLCVIFLWYSSQNTSCFMFCVSVWAFIKGMPFFCSIVHFVLYLCLWVNLGLWLTTLPAGSWHLKLFLFSSETILDFLLWCLFCCFLPSHLSGYDTPKPQRYIVLPKSQRFVYFLFSGIPDLNQNTSTYWPTSITPIPATD